MSNFIKDTPPHLSPCSGWRGSKVSMIDSPRICELFSNLLTAASVEPRQRKHNNSRAKTVSTQDGNNIVSRYDTHSPTHQHGTLFSRILTVNANMMLGNLPTRGSSRFTSARNAMYVCLVTESPKNTNGLLLSRISLNAFRR